MISANLGAIPSTPAPQSEYKVTNEYLDEYAQLFDHMTMLWDHRRMEAYHSAIMRNAENDFRDKVVLDVGTGTGVLAVWAAQAGAARVYAVEAGSLDVASQLASAHGFGDVVQVIHGRMEEVALPEQVDVVLSEWMGERLPPRHHEHRLSASHLLRSCPLPGYFLLRESMVESVLFARDRWLRPGGVMYPSEATLYVAPVAMPHFLARRREEVAQEMRSWEDLAAELAQRYSLDFGALRPRYEAEQVAYQYATGWQGYVAADALVGEAVAVLRASMATATAGDLFGWQKDVHILEASTATPVRALCGWFDVRFCGGDGGGGEAACVELSTSPRSPNTHWGQTVLPLRTPLRSPPLQLGLSQSRKTRHDINVTLSYNGHGAKASFEIGTRFGGVDDEPPAEGAADEDLDEA